MNFLMFIIYFTISLTTVFCSLYYFIKKRFQYWEKRNVPYLKPHGLLFGNSDKIASGEVSMFEAYRNFYRQLAPHRFGGIFLFYTPVLIIRDPDLIKSVLTKDFNYFVNHLPYAAKDYEPLTKYLFNIENDNWKHLRVKLTPTFSSGKIKLMFKFVNEISQQLVAILAEKQEVNVEMKDFMGRYAMDVISSCAFGLNSNSLKNPRCKFVKMCQKALEPNPTKRLKDLLNSFAPRIVHMLKINTFDKEVTNFFYGIVRETIDYRKKYNVHRNDFLQLILQVSREMEEKLTDQERLDFITAQCFLIFLAGYETTSSTLSFGLLELARHEDIQAKVQKEIDEALEKHNGQITYELLNEIPYTEQVIYETLRRNPPLPFIFRTCTKTYKIPESDLIVEKGSWVFIPVSGIHYDPDYYSNPEEFDPEHFSEEEKKLRPHHTFLSMGEGPRNCIGARFGFLQIKICFIQLLRNFTFTISPNMELPMTYMKHYLLTNSEKGIWLQCKKRKTDINVS